jgi:hypothetical protein
VCVNTIVDPFSALQITLCYLISINAVNYNVFSNPRSKISSTDIEMLVSSRIMQIIVFAGFLIHPVDNITVVVIK